MQHHLHQYPVPFEIASPAVNAPPAYVLEAAAPSNATMVSPATLPTARSNAKATRAGRDMAQAKHTTLHLSPLTVRPRLRPQGRRLHMVTELRMVTEPTSAFALVLRACLSQERARAIEIGARHIAVLKSAGHMSAAYAPLTIAALGRRPPQLGRPPITLLECCTGL